MDERTNVNREAESAEFVSSEPSVAEWTTTEAQVTTPSDLEVRVERIFDAPLERVWQAHTDPALLTRWWGRGNKVDIERYEAEPGGRWRFVEHADDGDYGFSGTIQEIRPQERIQQTFEWDGMEGKPLTETGTFEDLGDGRTRVVSTSVYHSKEERDGMLDMGMLDGMKASYAALDRLLASGG